MHIGIACRLYGRYNVRLPMFSVVMTASNSLWFSVRYSSVGIFFSFTSESRGRRRYSGDAINIILLYRILLQRRRLYVRARAVKPHTARRLGCIIILLCYTARNLYTQLDFFFLYTAASSTAARS